VNLPVSLSSLPRNRLLAWIVGKQDCDLKAVADHGRRFVPLRDRALERLKVRYGKRRQGWIFKAFSASGQLTAGDKKFRQARGEAGLPQKLAPYCGRHDYGTRVLQGAGNPAVAMGHRSPATAIKYQHPELEQVRAGVERDQRTNGHLDPERASE
jgi:integrase